MIYVINATTNDNTEISLSADVVYNKLQLAFCGDGYGGNECDVFGINVPHELAESVAQMIPAEGWVFKRPINKFRIPSMVNDERVVYRVFNDRNSENHEYSCNIGYYDNESRNNFTELILVVTDADKDSRIYVSPATFGTPVFSYVNSGDNRHKVTAYIPFRNKWSTFKQPAWISVVNKKTHDTKSYQLLTHRRKIDDKMFKSNTIVAVSPEVIDNLRSKSEHKSNDNGEHIRFSQKKKSDE